MEADVTFWLAFGAGVLSFLSPCTLPIFPAYLSYITGMSVKDIQDQNNPQIRKKVLLHSVFFLIGVATVFLSLGFGASLAGQWMQGVLTGDSGVFLQRIAGVFIIVMGLFVAGWINFSWLMREKRFSVKPKRSLGYTGSVFTGLGFAAGWTPCIGPIFGSILVLAASNPTQGMVYSVFYVLGFALPFLIFSFFVGSARAVVRYSQIFMKVGGSLMVVMGIMLYTGQLTRISNMLLRMVQDTWLSNLGTIIFRGIL
ncbi:cytochrome c biogenesis CcdA family protein [Salimicrobium salexigens]|uniref:Cytochrome c-type biogenesis protein n=1 Tax=Salimicrobium salexigens TaxID=908941 RepID=A0ABY1KU64_9BACI|nr:cytochrome c biogenesis protein CcdA [Salimicrobium salexigens]SIS79889.1 cytochrome c-type biogenesis protein [Salimicrobium salexigens]